MQQQVPGSTWWRENGCFRSRLCVWYSATQDSDWGKIMADVYGVYVLGSFEPVADVEQFIAALRWAEARRDSLRETGKLLELGFENSPEQRIRRQRGD